MASTPTLVQVPKITPVSFLNADAANTKKTIATAGASGSKVVGITISSTDSTLRVVQFWLTRSAVSYLISSVSVAAQAGFDGSTVNPIPLNSIQSSLPVDNDGQRYFFLESGDTLQVSLTTQVTSAKEVDVFAHFGNF